MLSKIPMEIIHNANFQSLLLNLVVPPTARQSGARRIISTATPTIIVNKNNNKHNDKEQKSHRQASIRIPGNILYFRRLASSSPASWVVAVFLSADVWQGTVNKRQATYYYTQSPNRACCGTIRRRNV